MSGGGSYFLVEEYECLPGVPVCSGGSISSPEHSLGLDWRTCVECGIEFNFGFPYFRYTTIGDAYAQLNFVVDEEVDGLVYQFTSYFEGEAYDGPVSMRVTEAPLPGAAWLFISAIISLSYLKHRRS